MHFYYCYRNQGLVRLETFPLEIPPEQVEILPSSSTPDSAPTHVDTKSEEGQNEIHKYLPDWVNPDMIYRESSIEKLKTLGHGQFGAIYKGRYRHRNSVYGIL